MTHNTKEEKGLRDENGNEDNTSKSGKITLAMVIREIVQFALIIILVVAPIRLFVAQPFIVSGRSMDPTFATGQYLIVDELSYHIGEPKRGDVVVLRYPRDPSRYFIKRVIGLPNETVEIKDGVVTIKTPKNKIGFTLTEPYVKFKKRETFTKTLGSDEYFVMGDNRAESLDSRAWGPVPRDLIVGRAFLRLFPIASAEVLPGEYEHI